MKKYSIMVCLLFVLMFVPFWIGNTVGKDIQNDIIQTKRINVSLFEARLEHNTGLINLQESYDLKNQLTDSILYQRDEQINSYRYLLGYLESRNRYDTDNGKFIGAYQFGPSALKHLGLGHITRADFLKNPNVFPDSLQDWAVIQLALENQKMLNTKLNLNRFIGKKINGVTITKGGVLAAAHLIGWYDCSMYLKSWGEYNPADGNGTSAFDYMKKFQNHDILAFDVEKDLKHDLSKVWISTKMPNVSVDKIYY